MEIQYVTKVPGKIITNGGYLVLNGHPCIAITPNAYSLSYVTKYPGIKPTIKISTNFEDEALFEYNNEFIATNDLEPSMNYCYNIIKSFYKLHNAKPYGIIEIFISLDRSLFSVQNSTIRESVKTGLGSSSVFLISIVDALLPAKISKDKFFKLCCDINLSINKITSCCDIAACLFGSIIYKKFEYERIKFSADYVLLLGSFNQSTSTREMIKTISENELWDELGKINNKLIQDINNAGNYETKLSYKTYLEKLRAISKDIVPDKQLEILTKTFDFDIFGCGVSGSGGEDAVWCIAERKYAHQVYEFWKDHFSYVSLIDSINCDPFIYNMKIQIE